MVACPHCGMDTDLVIPKPVETATRKIQMVLEGNGIEDSLDTVATVITVVGILTATVIVGTGLSEEIGTGGKTIATWFYGAEVVAVAVVFRLLLRALAEIIRLLKKSAGVPFSGKISQPGISQVQVCSKCQTEMAGEPRSCPNCQAVFVIPSQS